MVRFELKKIFGTLGGKIAVLFCIGFVILGCYLSCTSRVSTQDGQGQRLTGYKAVTAIREARRSWAGILDTAKIEAVIREQRRIAASPEYNSQDVDLRDIAYSWEEGFRPIRRMMTDAYNDSFDVYEYEDYWIPNNLSPSQAGDFYENRMTLLRQYLETGNGRDKFSSREKQWLIQHYQQWNTPIYYTYAMGWEQLLEYSMAPIGLIALVLGFLLTGTFSKEYRWKADSVFFSTAYGRSRAITAKLKAGFLATTILYWAAILVYTLVTLCYFGFDGATCPIQLADNFWEIPFNFTMWQTWLVIVLCGYVGILFVAALIMFLSAKVRSPGLCVVATFAAVLPGWFLQMPDIEALNNINVLPDRLLTALQYLQGRQAVKEVVDLGFTAASSLSVSLVVYGAIALVLIPLTYHTFRRIPSS